MQELEKMEESMPRGDQLSRQWRLLQLIDRPQGITVDDAARDLAVTIRTIWRDLDVLQKAGFPLYTERADDGNRGVWRVTEAFKRALPLTDRLDPRRRAGGWGRVSDDIERQIGGQWTARSRRSLDGLIKLVSDRP